MPRPGTSRDIFWVIPVIALVAGVFAYMFFQPQASGGLEVGKPMPEIAAEGWINGPGPSMADLKGKVVVVDAWAYWCGPCAREAPTLVRAHEQYQDRVQFIGLTAERKGSLAKSTAFIKRAKITWPNGYGAGKSLMEFDATTIPAVWVVGVDGKIVWNFASQGSIEDGIELALEQARNSPTANP